MLEFKILGPLEVCEGDRRLSCRSPKQRLLLGVLLLNANETVSSDRLSEALWGETPPRGAAKALQMHISQLRDLLEPERTRGASGEVLVTRPPGYELRVEPGRLDLDLFEDAVGRSKAAAETGRAGEAARSLHDALALWRGPPLADLSFEGALQSDIARLDELRLDALEERFEADLALGRHAGLIGELESHIAQQPLRERPRGQLMLALYRSGRQAEALEAYRDARRVLVEELGLEPGRRLKELERGILAQDPSLDASPVERLEEPVQPATSAELVGRETEMEELLSRFEASVSGRGGLVLVGGEPGVGKSRLAEALAGQAGARGARVLVGRCWEAGGAPAYWPWVQVLRSYLRDLDGVLLRSQVGRDGARLATIVPELRERLPDLPPAPASESESDRFQVFDAVASFLRRAAAARPLTVFLDDLHAADAPSLLLLRFMVAELAAAPILIVGCYRDTEVGPGHPLAEALPELTREGVVTRISLGGLSRPGTARLLELTMGRPAAGELIDRLHEETAGNPLFAGEVARLLAGQDADQRGGGEAALPIPQGVKEAIGLRLEGQSSEARDVLVLASVLGREFDLEAVERVSELQQDELYAAVEEAATARLVGEVPGGRGRMRFAHVLMRDSIYEAIPATRRPRLHRDIAEALEGLYARSPEAHLAELAHHYLAAGNAEAGKAIHYSSLAGDRAASQLGFEEAARHYANALDLIDAVAPDDERSCDLLLALGEALSRAGDATQAKEVLTRAAALADAGGWPDRLARAALAYCGRFSWARSGSDAAMVPLIERALDAVGEGDSPARVRLLARLAPAIRDEPRRDRRLMLAQEALDMARRIGDPVTLAYALNGYVPAVEGPGNVGLGEAAEELISLAQRIGDKELEYEGHDHRLHGAWALADPAAVEIELDALERLAEELGQPAHRWHAGSTRMVAALMKGLFAEAEELISGSKDLGRRAQSWNSVVSERVGLFVLRREQGRLAEMEDIVRRSVREFPTLLRFPCALAHLYAELGRPREARAVLDELLARDLAREHLDAEWLFSVSLLSNAGASAEDADVATAVYELLVPYEALYAEAPLEGTFGAVGRGLGVLATSLGRHDDAERHLRTAIETERRMGALPWLAHAQHDLASLLIARAGTGDEEQARVLLAAARSTYRELGMDVWAARAAALG